MAFLAPVWLDTGSYNANQDRMLIGSLLGSALPASLFAGGVGAVDAAHGVVGTDDLKVTANGTPNTTVHIGQGTYFIKGTEAKTQGVYHGVNDADYTLTGVPVGHATNPTWHLVIVKARDAGGGYSGSNNDALPFLVQGTPNASPSDPSLAAHPNALVLARIVMPALATNVGGGAGQGTIVDLRTRAKPWNASRGNLLDNASPSANPIGATGGPTQFVSWPAFHADGGRKLRIAVSTTLELNVVNAWNVYVAIGPVGSLAVIDTARVAFQSQTNFSRVVTWDPPSAGEYQVGLFALLVGGAANTMQLLSGMSHRVVIDDDGPSA